MSDSQTERIRLQKALSAAGLMSRRKAEDAIRAERVHIDGRVAVLGDRVDPNIDAVTVDGSLVPVAPARITYLLNKPAGVISTTEDTHGRQTVVDLVPNTHRVWPVGRLDAESEGLLLITNDGTLTNLITHPRYGVTKTYVVLLEGDVSARIIRKLEEGVMLDDGLARALTARVKDRTRGRTLVELVLGEGRNREIRRMAEALDITVDRLTRTAIGSLSDQTLTPGNHRVLTPGEVWSLYKTANQVKPA